MGFWDAVKSAGQKGANISESIGKTRARVNEYVMIALAIVATIAGVLWLAANMRRKDDDKNRAPNMKWGPFVLFLGAILSGLLAWYQSYVATSTSGFAKITRQFQGLDTAGSLISKLF